MGMNLVYQAVCEKESFAPRRVLGRRNTPRFDVFFLQLGDALAQKRVFQKRLRLIGALDSQLLVVIAHCCVSSLGADCGCAAAFAMSAMWPMSARSLSACWRISSSWCVCMAAACAWCLPAGGRLAAASMRPFSGRDTCRERRPPS